MMDYAQYDQHHNQCSELPFLPSTFSMLPESGLQPYIHQNSPRNASPLLPSQSRWSWPYQPTEYPQNAVPGVGTPSPHSLSSLVQAAAMATAAASGVVNPYAMYPNPDTPESVPPPNIRIGHELQAEDMQKPDKRRLRLGAWHKAAERRRRGKINERIQELSHLIPQHPFDYDKIKNRLQNNLSSGDDAGAVGFKVGDRTPPEELPTASQTLNKDLPIIIKGQQLDASADTGSDECGMPKDVADHLGLKVRSGPSDIKEFEGGNGRKIKSIGRATADCSFWNEPGRKLRCVFYVFERLIVPLIMGRKFLESTDTLTQHEDRLVDRAPRAGPCRVMHLSRPKRRMRCYIDSDLVEANPDTGAEMELVSPDFIKRKGYVVDAPDAAHEEVQFVDGSTARTQGQVTMKFEAYSEAFQGAVPSKAQYRTFYVLDGLTTDILLGEDLLYRIKAFTEHASSFVDLDDFGMPVELKGIVWLDRAEQRLARIFGGDPIGLSAASTLGSAGTDTQSRMQRFTSAIGRVTGARTQGEALRAARRELDFERDRDNRDARENARQEAADLRIDRLPPSQRAAAEEQEEKVRQAFDDDQKQRRQQHEAALATAVRHVPMA